MRNTDNMLEDDNIIKKHPIFIAVLILLYICLAISPSIMQWNIHPKKVVCSSLTNACSLKEFAYKHEICWGDLIPRRRYSRAHCRIPKYQTSVVELLPLSEVRDVIIKDERGKFRVYLKGDKDREVSIAAYKKYDDAKFLSSNLMAHIKKWQEQYAVSDFEDGETFSYDF